MGGELDWKIDHFHWVAAVAGASFVTLLLTKDRF